MDGKSHSSNSKICRLCPSDEFLTDLYHPSNLEIRKVINLFVNIEGENSSKLPKFICEVCEHIVQSIIDFRDKCKERDNELRGKVEGKSNSIKIEDLTKIEEILPIEVLIIKEEEDPDDFLVEYLDNEQLEDEILEEVNKKTTNKPKPKRDRSKRDWPCLLCKKVYSCWSDLNEHKKADHLQCPVCLKSFDSYLKMAHHKRNIHASDTHCHLCGKHIVNRVRLLKHIRSFHNMERNHKCEICGAAFFHNSKLKVHLFTHNEPNSEKCDFENCGKMFKNVASMVYHKKSHFPHLKPVTGKTNPKTNPKKYIQQSKTIICQYCGKILKSTTGYQIHMRVHRNEKPLDCPDCDKKFRDKRSLTVHGLIHKNLRAFQCDLCSKSFYTSGAMKNHKISIHETEMKHECHICGKRTKMKSNLTLHMKTHGFGKNKNELN